MKPRERLRRIGNHRKRVLWFKRHKELRTRIASSKVRDLTKRSKKSH